MKPKIIILFGGESFEREISLQSSKEVIKHINHKKYDVTPIEVPKEKDSRWIHSLLNISPDVIFNLLHGGNGENGSVSGLLNCLKIPFIGNGVLADAVSMNKNLCKTLLKSVGVPVCEDIFIKKNQNVSDFDEKINELGFPLIVKPNKGGASIGISIAENLIETKNAVNNIIKTYNDSVIIEKFIKGKEVTCVTLRENDSIKIMPVLDVSTDRGFYDYEAKYVNTDSRLEFSTLPFFIRKMIEDIAKKVFTVLECQGICCVDLIVHEEQVYFIEVNTVPGFTPNSTVTRTLKKLDISMESFIDNLIENLL